METYIIRNWQNDNIIYQGGFETIGDCLEDAILKTVPLHYANLRGLNLTNANLDEIKGEYIDFSSSNLMGANISDARLTAANFSNTNLPAACFAQSHLEHCDFTGAICGNTEFAGAVMKHCFFDTLSALSQNFIDMQTIKDCIFAEDTMTSCRFNSAPIAVKGLQLPVILFDDHMKLGSHLKLYSDWTDLLINPMNERRELSSLTYQLLTKYAASLFMLAEHHGYYATELAKENNLYQTDKSH